MQWHSNQVECLSLYTRVFDMWRHDSGVFHHIYHIVLLLPLLFWLVVTWVCMLGQFGTVMELELSKVHNC